MVLQTLIPGVEHAEEPDIGTEMPGSRAIFKMVAALAWNSRL